MDVNKYFQQVNAESQQIFSLTLSNEIEQIGRCNYLSTCIFEFSENIQDKNERELLITSSSQLESATLSLTLGLYRQAFSTLRLAFELSLGAVYFSINKLEHAEWVAGKGDIKWSRLIDVESGILSVRFSNAFFKDLSAFITNYHTKATNVYRTLSEFVHGNYETWSKSGIKLKINKDLIASYFDQFFQVTDIIIFALSCRYFNEFEPTTRESMESIFNEMIHIEPIRVLLGGPKN